LASGCFFSFLLPIFSLASVAKVNFSRGSGIFGHGENLEKKIGIKSEKMENSCKNLALYITIR